MAKEFKFKEAEAKWLKNALARQERLAKTRQYKRQTSEKLIKLFASIHRKLKVTDAIALKRAEAKELEKMVKNYRERLTVEVIPAYMQRINSNPEGKDRYGKYLVMAQALTGVLENLGNRLSEFQ